MARREEDTIGEYSRVLANVPEEMWRRFWSGRGEMRRSFGEHFKGAKPLWDYGLFRLKFAEIYSGVSAAFLTRELGDPSEFWRPFEVLFRDVTGTKRKESAREKMRRVAEMFTVEHH